MLVPDITNLAKLALLEQPFSIFDYTTIRLIIIFERNKGDFASLNRILRRNFGMLCRYDE